MRDPQQIKDGKVNDALLTQEEYQKLRQKVVKALRQKLVVRQIFRDLYSAPLGIGVEEFGYDKETDMSAAEVAYEFKHFSEDIPETTRGTIKIPLLAKKFFIPRRTLAASRRLGRPLDSRSANSAAYRVANLENQLIFQGWASDGSNYDINGFYQAAGNDYSTSKDFGTAGNAIDAVSGAIALLNNDEVYGPYTLFLNPTQFGELAASVLSSGVREIEVVKALLSAEEEGTTAPRNIRSGKIYGVPYITAGTGLLIGNVPEFAEIVVGADADTEIWEHPDHIGTKGMVFEALVPIVYEPNALSKLSSI